MSSLYSSTISSKSNWFSLKHILVSANDQTANQSHKNIQSLIGRSTSELKIKRLSALSCLLDELIIHRILPFHVAFHEYSAKVPWIADSSTQNFSKQTFRDALLSKNGLPVVIFQHATQR